MNDELRDAIKEHFSVTGFMGRINQALVSDRKNVYNVTITFDTLNLEPKVHIEKDMDRTFKNLVKPTGKVDNPDD